MAKLIDIVFDGPPGPQSGRFVEVENERGASISFGQWVERDDGYWALRISDISADMPEIREVLEALIDHPEGCMCPNNGGGDCDWCQAVDHAKLVIAAIETPKEILERRL